jgi:putative acetyltransferase
VHEAAFGRPAEARLAAQLRQEASPLVSLVAERAGRVIGHVLFSPVTVEGERPGPAAASLASEAKPRGGSPRAGAPFARADRAELAAGALGPVGVLPDAQGLGIGAALIRAGIEACRALDWRVLFVLGHPAYYARFGFQRAAPRGLHYASHAFDAAFQVQELVPGALVGVAGWVRYHAAFSESG